jgi:hypothetical protein
MTFSSKFIINTINPSNAMDVFFDQFDKTWAEGLPENSEKYFTVAPNENILDGIDDKSITYFYNKDWFRSDDFKVDHDGVHILFSGCSNTEGIGAKKEDIWSYSLNSKFKNSDGFFNLAKSGWGWEKIIFNFMTYIKKYGKPDYYFILLPNIGRFFDWDEKESKWEYVQRYQSDAKTINVKTIDYNPLSIKQHRERFISFVMGWKFFEFFCEQIYFCFSFCAF